jgi:hypothetical protein
MACRGIRARRTTSVLFALAVAFAGACPTLARREPAGGLAGLADPHYGRALRASSADPTGGNLDFRVVAPGDSVTLLEHDGAGVIHRVLVTFLPRMSGPTDARVPLGGTVEDSVAVHRQAILRMYWDGEKTPSVESPVGDFFGVGFGDQREVVSAPVSQTTGGYACYWPMPFRRSARVTLTNLAPVAMLLWWDVDYTAVRSLDPRIRYFHAHWRREQRTSPARPYTILDAKGAGHYVGTALFAQTVDPAPPNLVFLEGDEEISVDGESSPSIRGTGHEEYFNGGFYFERGPSTGAPYHGVVLKDEATGRVSAFRWHVEDPIPCRKSIRVAIEHGSNNLVLADYSSVAFWYQTEPHAAFEPFPEAALLLPSPIVP